MGVSITAYKGVTLIDNPTRLDEGGFEPQNCVEIYVGEEWRQADDLKQGQVYECQDCFCGLSISCTSFNNLRNELAKIADYQPVYTEWRCKYLEGAWADAEKGKTGLLMDLLDFPDNCGEIGNQSCQNILKDLQSLKDRVIELDELYQGRFQQLLETFEFVGNDGFVVFR